MQVYDLKNSKPFINYFIVFYIFDLLLLPYFAASTPVSFFLMILMSPFLFSVKRNYLVAYFVLLIIMLASIVNGLSIYSSGSLDNLKRILQMSLVLSLFFLNLKNVDFNFVQNCIIKIINLFVLYLVSLMIISLFNPELYIFMLNIFSPNDIEMIYGNVEMFRFSYIFSDPNTLGYLLVFITVFHLFHSKKFILSFVIYTALFFLILSTQSRGSLLSFGAVSLIFLISRANFSFNTIKFLSVIILCILTIYFSFQDYFLFITDAFEKRSEIEEAMGTGLGGGRDKKYVYLLQNFNFNLYGVGYSLYIEGLEFRPHSDLIRIILSYGILYLLVFIGLFVSVRFKNFVLFFAFLFPFLLNSILDDYRLFGVFVIFFIIMKYDNRLATSSARSHV